MAKVEAWYEQDLKRPVRINYLDGSFFNQDAAGSRIGVKVYSDGQAVTLAGSITGYCVQADGTTVPISGTRSGNMAYIDIPQSALSVPGPLTVTIKNTESSVITTLCAVVGIVTQSRTGVQVDPGQTVTDWTNQISAQLQACQDAADNMGAMVAVPYASLTFPVEVGTYTTNSGNLYCCTTRIETSETFTPGHWRQTKVCNEISDLRSAIAQKTNNLAEIKSGVNGTELQDLAYKVIENGIKITGTSSVDGVLVATEEITLQAGSYFFGTRAGAVTGIALQLIKMVNHSVDSLIDSTSTYKTVTISEETTVIIRIAHNKNVTINGTVYIELVKDNVYGVFIPPIVATDDLARLYEFNDTHTKKVVGGTDLNDVIDYGLHEMSFGDSFTNDPVGANNYRLLSVEPQPNANGSVWQTLIHYNLTYSYFAIYKRFRTNSTAVWGSWNKVYDMGSLDNALKTYGYIDNNTDLNTLIESAVYTVLSSRTLTNAPEDYASSSSVLIVLPTISGSTTAMVVQVYINYTKATIHYRAKGHGSSTWGDWKNQSAGYQELGVLATNTDLNTLTDQGFWTILSNRVLTNAPDNYASSSSMLSVNPSLSGSANGQIYQYYYNWSKQTLHMRLRPANSSTWTEWRLLEHGIANESEIGKILDYQDYSNQSTTENKGVTLDLLIYNVAHYNRDRGQPGILPSLYNEKLSNIKKLLQFANADVLFITEEAQYVNEDETKTASNYLYRPVYPKTIADTETNIRTKQTLTNTGTYELTSVGRVLRYGTLTINGTDILLVCAHFTTSDASSRLRDLQETIAFCKAQNISHYIIAGDLNTLTEDDRTNLATTCISESVEYANGGYLGWVETHWQNYPLDNLLCSPNIIINRFESMNNWFNSLYSDHYPVRANVTILT